MKEVEKTRKCVLDSLHNSLTMAIIRVTSGTVWVWAFDWEAAGIILRYCPVKVHKQMDAFEGGRTTGSMTTSTERLEVFYLIVFQYQRTTPDVFFHHITPRFVDANKRGGAVSFVIDSAVIAVVLDLGSGEFFSYLYEKFVRQPGL